MQKSALFLVGLIDNLASLALVMGFEVGAFLTS